MAIWFTSDLHLNHAAAIRMCERPFASIEEMNRTLIDNMNSKIKKSDTLYILGDLSYKGTVAQANDLIAQIHGRKILVKGNHDRGYDPALFQEISDFKTFNIYRDGEKYSICLMHYPMVSWPNSQHGSIHLHGHQHNKPYYNLRMRKAGILRYDVGVDANNYFPVSFQELVEFMRL